MSAFFDPPYRSVARPAEAGPCRDTVIRKPPKAAGFPRLARLPEFDLSPPGSHSGASELRLRVLREEEQEPEGTKQERPAPDEFLRPAVEPAPGDLEDEEWDGILAAAGGFAQQDAFDHWLEDAWDDEEPEPDIHDFWWEDLED